MVSVLKAQWATNLKLLNAVVLGISILEHLPDKFHSGSCRHRVGANFLIPMELPLVAKSFAIRYRAFL
jgi:hypothetical protein